jgi:hypothetical protein
VVVTPQYLTIVRRRTLAQSDPCHERRLSIWPYAIWSSDQVIWSCGYLLIGVNERAIRISAISPIVHISISR